MREALLILSGVEGEREEGNCTNDGCSGRELRDGSAAGSVRGEDAELHEHDCLYDRSTAELPKDYEATGERAGDEGRERLHRANALHQTSGVSENEVQFGG